MAPTPQPSLPPSQPAPFRHLGTGAADRSVRVQMVIALVAGLVMVAVPLYLWRRPKADPSARPASSADGAGGGSSMSALASASGGAAVPDPPSPRGVTLGEPKISKCKKAGGKTPPEQCDRQPFFEEALVKAIRDNVSCAPMLPTGGTINYVLDVDYKAKKVKTWSGKSSTVKKKQAKEVLACVSRALPSADWSQIPHQHQKYSITLMATYPPSGGTGGPLLAVRRFERSWLGATCPTGAWSGGLRREVRRRDPERAGER
jgi:hypothetical protein